MSHTTAAKTKQICLKLNPVQCRKLEQRAEQRGVSLSLWMRTILLQVANQPAREGYLRVKEPNGDLI